ncbi:chemosensory receptor b [Plakobranchus ocellatus]|uniref:Chemosensory receptor b n=1 Tax=Plakobranchus ocellatus TaxID=259542 RepID=A0AAV3Y090_9GAST|nr:chemosensory receptor b [Plakobranchus ocellatus]
MDVDVFNQTKSSVGEDAVRAGIVSSTTRLYIVLTSSALVHAVGTFGIITNIINIAVFATQGFADSVNISLFTLAISDLFSILAAQWLMICLNPWFQSNLKLSFFAAETQTLTGGYVHVFFSRVSAWITAFVSLERSVAVTQPFRVRRIFTRRVTTVFNLMVFPVVWSGAAPLYATSRLTDKFYPPPINLTLVGLVYLPNHKHVMSITSPLTEMFGPLACFTIVIVCTMIIRIKVTKMARWRSKVTGHGVNETDKTNMTEGSQTAKQPFKKAPAAEHQLKSKENLCNTDKTDFAKSKTQNDDPSLHNEKTNSIFTVHSEQKAGNGHKDMKNSEATAPKSENTPIPTRSTTSPSTKSTGTISHKEQRLVVMVSGVSAIFIVCYTPLVVQLASRIIVPELNSTGRYRNLNASIGTIGVLLGCINASINAIVYWTMSSKYRTTFNGLLIACK